MADISTELQAIMSAVYGEEVRGSIHDAIALINDVCEATLTTGTDVISQNSSIEGYFDGSLYINTATDDLWLCDGTQWVWQANLTGNGIDHIEKTSSGGGTYGLIDTYTIYFTYGNTTTFQVTNGKTAYQYAVDGGYPDTEADFNSDLANFKHYADTADERAEDSEAYALGTRDGTAVGSTDPTYHNNSKYYSEQSSASASASDSSAEDSEAYAVGKRDGVDVTSGDVAYHNNSKYYSEQSSASASASDSSASDSNTYSQSSEAYAKGTRGGQAVASDDPAYHNNSKYYKELADEFAEDSEAYAVGKRDGTDVTSGDPAYHNNSKFWSGEANDHAEDSEAYAVGKRDGVDVDSSDPAYHNNSKYYSIQADGRAEDSEAYAIGKRDGTDIPSTDPAYHNNSKYFSDQSDLRAEDSEAYAIGKRDGTDVTSGDVAYHNNSKYYSGLAGTSATAAALSETNAEGSAEDSEAWAVGQRNGVDVPSTDPTYHNNAKYWSQQAAGQSFAGLNDVDINSSTLANGQVPKYNSQTQKWENEDDYESKQASSGGTDLSLVTTGEKYTWNEKDDAPVVLTKTLVSPNTQVTFTDAAITANARISVFTNVPGLNYDSMDASTTNTIVLTFEAQSSDITVQLVIR